MWMKALLRLVIGSLAFWVGALCAQGSGAAASGNEPPPAKDVPQKIELIEVKESASNYDARREDTASKIVVTEQEIMKFGDTELAAVLKRLPASRIPRRRLTSGESPTSRSPSTTGS